MPKGWLYLCTVADWYSRKVQSWRLSNTMDVQFCINAVQEAMNRWGTPAIFNTDQGSQFTSDAFTTLLKRHGIRISMDGSEPGGTMSLSSACGAPSSTRRSISKPMQAHDQVTPDEAYFAALPFAQMQAA